MNEIWKEVVGYEGIYEVSNLGRVKSLSRKEWCVRNNSFRVRKEKFLSLYLNNNGYYRVILCKKNKKTTRSVHSLVAQEFLNHKRCGAELVVNHINFIKTDNRVDNLEIITTRENTNMKHIKSSSKYVGVSWRKDIKKWASSIGIGEKRIHLGIFDDEEEASLCRENALKAHLNREEIVVKLQPTASKYKGVCFNKNKNKWIARKTINKKTKNLGYFTSELEAHQAYQNTNSCL